MQSGSRLSLRRVSLRRGSISALPQKNQEIPWDILERLLMPFLFCHAAAIIISTFLHTFGISNASTFAIFMWFSISTIGAVLFYHFVKVLPLERSPIGWYLAKKLDDLGFTIYAGFNVEDLEECEEAKILKEETSGRMKVLKLDLTSEKTKGFAQRIQYFK
uniref:Uncharacterized protein n=1 Tax=Megaselia scalaris TaxID=36166 RepID=T1GYK6_MEGSC